MIASGNERTYKELLAGWDFEHALNEGLASATAAAIIADATEGEIPRYDAILVDEDRVSCRPGGMPSVSSCVSKAKRSSPVNASQDVYATAASWDDAAAIRAGFHGPPAELRTSYRLPIRLAELAREYAEEFLPATARLLPEPDATQQLALNVRLRWHQTSLDAVGQTAVEELLAFEGVPFADRVSLVTRVEVGQAIEAMLGQRRIKVTSTFHQGSEARRRQKRHFFKGSEKVKGTTIHGFKGWESRAVIVCLTGIASPQLTYAALTRLKSSDSGSYLTVVSADSTLADLGSRWGQFEQA